MIHEVSSSSGDSKTESVFDGSQYSDEPNGLVLGGICLSEDIMGVLFSFVDCESLLRCRLVCRVWKEIIDTNVWRLKIHRDAYRVLQSSVVNMKCPWIVYYWICKKRPFGRNFVKNNCGQDGMKHWSCIDNGGHGWQVEDPPTGADELPSELGHTSCFSTSYHSCKKEQMIDLHSEGCVHRIMDELQPCIEISEWYAGRWDCGCIYDLKVSLLNGEKDEIDRYNARKKINQWEGREWHKVMHRFCDYGPGVRYIKVCHGGRDTQFWAGNYGSKMSGACVSILLTNHTPADEVPSDSNDDFSSTRDSSSDFDYHFEDDYEEEEQEELGEEVEEQENGNADPPQQEDRLQQCLVV